MSSRDILNFPSKWPSSFPKSNVRTRVLTYVFKNDSKVETFLNFIKNKLPKALVSVFKDTDGYTNVTITQTSGGTATAASSPYSPCPDGSAGTITAGGKLFCPH